MVRKRAMIVSILLLECTGLEAIASAFDAVGDVGIPGGAMTS
jgi:hypothetical protein